MRHLLIMLTTSLIFIANVSIAKTWAEAINDVGVLQSQYEAAADALMPADDYQRSAIAYEFGNSAEFIDSEKHLCAILGRRMGRPEAIVHLEPPLPPLTSDGLTLATTAASLYNWLRMANRFNDMTQPEWVVRWNFECVGQHGIPVSTVEGETTKFFYAVNGTYLWVYGAIVDGYADELAAALDANPEVQTVGIASAGGNVWEAMAAGLDIRSRGLGTQLSSDCYSACPSVFMGGVQRAVFRPHPEIGFHQVYTGEGVPIPFESDTYLRLWAYFNAMGAVANAVVAAMWSASPFEMEIPSLETLCSAGVVTFVQGRGNC